MSSPILSRLIFRYKEEKELKQNRPHYNVQRAGIYSTRGKVKRTTMNDGERLRKKINADTMTIKRLDGKILHIHQEREIVKQVQTK